jgi:nifR3 family TIM-barrel protein
MRDAATIALAEGADLIDINMGCPVRKVVKTGAGAALLKNLDRAEAIMRALNRAPALPYTIKIRRGWDEEHPVLERFIDLATEYGALALTCHPRTAAMMFSGRADWDVLGRAAAHAGLPVLGSGDLNGVDQALAALQRPGIAGIMLGRGTLGRPWFFKEIMARRDQNRSWHPKPELKLQTIIEHGRLLRDEYGDKTGLLLYRKHLAWYSRGLPGAAAFRQRLFTIGDFTALTEAIGTLITRTGQENSVQLRPAPGT